jgi:predicted Ser/Thr protein kinase
MKNKDVQSNHLKELGILSDTRSSGKLEHSLNEIGDRTLHFTDYTLGRKKQRHVFTNDAVFTQYLTQRTDVATWKIEDTRTQQILYFHREPFLGEIECFKSEGSLNRILSKETAGQWEVVRLDVPSDQQKPTYILDKSSWFTQQFIEFNSKEAFLIACAQNAQQHGFWNRFYLAGCSFLMATAGIISHRISHPKLSAFDGYSLASQLSNKINFPHTNILGPLSLLANWLPLNLAQTTVGNTTFLNEWGGYSLAYIGGIMLTSDNNVLVVGSSASNMTALKFSMEGELLEAQALGEIGPGNIYLTGNNGYKAVTATTDGGWAVAGYTDGFGINGDAFFLAKWNNNGTLNWVKTVAGGSNCGSEAYSLTATKDDAIIVAGFTCSFPPVTGNNNDDNLLLIKLANNGTLLWSYNIGIGIPGCSLGVGGVSIIPTTDGDFAIVSSANSCSSSADGYDDVFLVKFASDGTLRWTSILGGNNGQNGYGCHGSDLTATSDDGIATIGYTEDGLGTSGTGFLLTKWDNNGTLHWVKTVLYPANPYSYGYGITAVEDGVVFVGQNYYYGIVGKFLNDGTFLWGNTVNAGDSYLYSITATTSGELFIAGLNEYSSGIQLMKFNNTGNIANCNNVQAFLPSPYWQIDTETTNANLTYLSAVAVSVSLTVTDVISVIVPQNIVSSFNENITYCYSPIATTSTTSTSTSGTTLSTSSTSTNQISTITSGTSSIATAGTSTITAGNTTGIVAVNTISTTAAVTATSGINSAGLTTSVASLSSGMAKLTTATGTSSTNNLAALTGGSSQTVIIAAAAGGGAVLMSILVGSGVWCYKRKQRLTKSPSQVELASTPSNDSSPGLLQSTIVSAQAPTASSSTSSDTKLLLSSQEEAATKTGSLRVTDWQNSFQINYAELALERELGRGGFGIVYKGKWRNSDVAIKQLHLTQPSPSSLEEFQKEMAIMARLRCPQIVQFYGAYFEPCYGIVMEYMPVGSLYAVLHNNKPLDWEIRHQIAIDIACGISFLHAETILHRDLKSLNVLLDEHYHAKLTDFGLAKIKNESSSTATSHSVGTLAWMAPELFQRHAKYSQQSDIYSFGMVLWELVSREVPFKDAHSPELIAKWVPEGEREEIPKDTPPKIAHLIKLCWANDIPKRPTANDVVKYLKNEEGLSSIQNESMEYRSNFNSGPTP